MQLKLPTPLSATAPAFAGPEQTAGAFAYALHRYYSRRRRYYL